MSGRKQILADIAHPGQNIVIRPVNTRPHDERKAAE